MDRKQTFSYLLASFGLLATISIFPQLALSQVQAPAPTPAPAVQQAKSPGEIAFDRLTDYQKSNLERVYNDWAFLAKYRDFNNALPPAAAGESRVVFMGDSITEGWGQSGTTPPPDRATFFPGRPYVNRGISGQTTPQMLVRFRQDVVALKPKVVVILAGTNDLAGVTGPAPEGVMAENFMS